MLQDLSVRYVIVGHSERRFHFHENDRDVNEKTRAVIEAGLRPIVCVGETLHQRETDNTEQVLKAQLENGLAEIGDALGDAVIAYEPVWAIGTGRTATIEQAQSAHEFIRRTVASLAGREVADAIRIQYGGSVKPDNAAGLFSQPDVDGGLIGGASLDAASFLAIVRAAA
jgi:triosephosphate isomerase